MSVAYVSNSGNALIDALLAGYRWKSSVVTFSFPDALSSWSTSALVGYESPATYREPWQAGFRSFDAGQQDVFRTILDGWGRVANLDFVEVGDVQSFRGQIRAAFTVVEGGTGAVAWTYYPAAAEFGGDLWVSGVGKVATANWVKGSYGYFAILHEVGHALGLKHPFSGDYKLPANLDSQSYSVMSYAAYEGNQDTSFSYYPTTPMTLDILALQYIYGENISAFPDNTLWFYDDARVYHETIWDSGGDDTLQYSGVLDGFFDMHPGAASQIGLPVYVCDDDGNGLTRVSNVWLAQGVSLENLVAGAGNDYVIGNDLSNFIDGGSGFDTLLVEDVVGEFSLSNHGDEWYLKRLSGAEEMDQLRQVERVMFADASKALDLLPAQAGGVALSVLGTVAYDYLLDPWVAGWVLSRADQGRSAASIFAELVDSGLIAQLAGGGTEEDLVWLAGRNILGDKMTSEVAAVLVPLFQEFDLALSDFLVTASQTALNTEHIALLGVYEAGLSFVY